MLAEMCRPSSRLLAGPVLRTRITNIVNLSTRRLEIAHRRIKCMAISANYPRKVNRSDRHIPANNHRASRGRLCPSYRVPGHLHVRRQEKKRRTLPSKKEKTGHQACPPWSRYACSRLIVAVKRSWVPLESV